MYLLYNLSKYRVRVNDETKLLEIDKNKEPMPYPQAAEAAARSAKSDSENFRRRAAVPAAGDGNWRTRRRNGPMSVS